MQTVLPLVSFLAANPDRVRAGQVARASSVRFKPGIDIKPTTGQVHLSQPTQAVDARTPGKGAGR